MLRNEPLVVTWFASGVPVRSGAPKMTWEILLVTALTELPLALTAPVWPSM